MKKPFIKHDLFACNDDKIKKLLTRFHEAGYGIWWSIIEQLSQNEEHRLSFSDLVERVQSDLRARNTTTISAVVSYSIESNLLKEEDELIYSERVLAQYAEIDELRKKNSENCKKRWEEEKKAKGLYEKDTVVLGALYEGNTDNKDIKDNKDTKERKDTKVSQRKDYISFVQQCYSTSCSGKFPSILKMSEAREAHCYNLVERFGKEKVKEGFERASKSSFLCGANNQNWRAHFDWFILPNNFLKVLEGNYDDAVRNQSRKLPPSSISSREAIEASMNAEGGIDL